MDILLLNTSDYIGKEVGEWVIEDATESGISFAFLLKQNEKSKVFFIRKNVIKANVINLPNDVYELWYKDYEDSKLLTLSEISDIDIVLNEMKILIEKYSKFDK